MSHTCHAMNCKAHCKPEFLMCGRHWRCVPSSLQRAVYRHYRPGQCDDMNFTRAWHLAATRAICAVAIGEGLMSNEEARGRVERLEAMHDEREAEERGQRQSTLFGEE